MATKMIAIVNPECADRVFVDNLQNAVQICPPPKFDIGRPTLTTLFDEWNKRFHEDEVNPRPYMLMFNFRYNNRSISEIGHAGNVIKKYVRETAETANFICTMFDMLEEVDEVNYLL